MARILSTCSRFPRNWMEIDASRNLSAASFLFGLLENIIRAVNDEIKYSILCLRRCSEIWRETASWCDTNATTMAIMAGIVIFQNSTDENNAHIFKATTQAEPR